MPSILNHFIYIWEKVIKCKKKKIWKQHFLFSFLFLLLSSFFLENLWKDCMFLSSYILYVDLSVLTYFTCFSCTSFYNLALTKMFWNLTFSSSYPSINQAVLLYLWRIGRQGDLWVKMWNQVIIDTQESPFTAIYHLQNFYMSHFLIWLRDALVFMQQDPCFETSLE